MQTWCDETDLYDGAPNKFYLQEFQKMTDNMGCERDATRPIYTTITLTNRTPRYSISFLFNRSLALFFFSLFRLVILGLGVFNTIYLVSFTGHVHNKKIAFEGSHLQNL